MQTDPSAQLSVCILVPVDSTSMQSCISVRGYPVARGSLHVKSPTVLTEHFSLQPQPVRQNGSHSPGRGVQSRRASKQIGFFSAAAPTSLSVLSTMASPSRPPSPGIRQHCIVLVSHLNPSGQAFPTPASRLHLKPPSLILRL